jgi:hypothetical protein
MSVAAAGIKKKHAIEELDPARWAKVVGHSPLLIMSYAPWLGNIIDLVKKWNEVGKELEHSPIWVSRIDVDAFIEWRTQQQLLGMPAIAYYPKHPTENFHPHGTKCLFLLMQRAHRCTRSFVDHSAAILAALNFALIFSPCCDTQPPSVLPAEF